MARTSDEPRIGIALGGGGAAALAEIGALEVLREAGLAPSSIAGTSAGAVVGAAYAAGHLDELRDAICPMTRRRALWLFEPRWPRSGIFTGNPSMGFLRPFVGERIEELPIGFGAVATDLETGDDVVLDSGPVIDGLRASIAVPGLFAPFPYDGRWLVDGALSNPIPVGVARKLGAEFVIAVHVLPIGDRTHGTFRAACRELRDTRPGRWIRRLVNWNGRLEDLPADAPRDVDAGPESAVPPLTLAAVLSQASSIVQARIATGRLEDEAPDYLLTIPIPAAGLFDFAGTTRAVTLGREVARDALHEIRREVDRMAARIRMRRVGPWWPGRPASGPSPGRATGRRAAVRDAAPTGGAPLRGLRTSVSAEPPRR